MKPIPTIALVILSVVTTILLMRQCTPTKTVTIEKITYDTVTQVVNYPVDRPVPTPVIKWKTKVVHLTSQAMIDSAVARIEADRDSCTANAAKLLSQLLLNESPVAPPVDLFENEKLQEYSDIVRAPNYIAKWRAGVYGSLEEMDLQVDVINTTKTVSEKKRSLGFTAGVIYLDKIDTPIGLSYDNSKIGIQAAYLPLNKGASLTLKQTLFKF